MLLKRLRSILVQDARTPYGPHQTITEVLLREVWGFGTTQKVPQTKAAACFYHYETLLRDRHLLDDQNTILRESDHQAADVAALIAILKSHHQHTLAEIHAHLRDHPPGWILSYGNPQTIDSVLQFAIRLWLFTKPDLTDQTRTLQDAIRVPLMSLASPSNSWLWLDFSAETLRRRGGFKIEYTSELSQHLTFASRSVIRVFSHACVLERYGEASNGSVESKLYPPGLLREVGKTLNLLWPVEDYHISKHVARVEERKFVDIEANMGHEDKHNLTTYIYFGARLAKIQERLELEEHRRGTAFGLRIAVWGIVLTALFGLVSAAVGAVAMWAALKQIQVI